METQPACQYVKDEDPNAPAPQQEPWTFSPTVPKPIDLTLPQPNPMGPVAPAPGAQSNPILSPVPALPGAAPPAAPSPAQLFPNQGPDVPTIPTPGGPLQVMPWFHDPNSPIDNLPDGPEKPQHQPFPDSQ